MSLTPRRILALTALVLMLGVASIPSPATSAPAKGSSCARPWVVQYDYESGNGIHGNRDRIAVRMVGDPFSDRNFNLVRISWARKSGARVICSSTGRIYSGEVVECSGNVTRRTLSWRSNGPGNGWCEFKVPKGNGNDLGPMKVTAARRR